MYQNQPMVQQGQAVEAGGARGAGMGFLRRQKALSPASPSAAPVLPLPLLGLGVHVA